MEEVRNIVSHALAERSAKVIKVRQPLALLKIKNKKSKIKDNYKLLDLIKDEVNVKEIIFDDNIKSDILLDLNITPELYEEGVIRDFIRSVQDLRKEKGLRPENEISASILVQSKLKIILEKNKEFLMKKIRARKVLIGVIPDNLGKGQEIKIKVIKPITQ